MSPRLNPLIAPSHVVPAAEASHEGAAAETAAHHADEEDDTAIEGAMQFQQNFPGQLTTRELGAHRVAHTPYKSLVRGMRARARAQC